MNLDDLSCIRKQLHNKPELSGEEGNTSSQIISYLKKLQPSELITNVGGYGILCVYDSKKPGPCIVFRAELDALPIAEKGNRDYKSINPGVSHACGHDGHMAILLGLAYYLSQKSDDITGKVILLFQPAEETAEGAKKIMQDSRFHDLHPTHIFGLHNIPQYPLGKFLLRKDVFASASKGLIIRFHGISSHAGQPKQGLSPLNRMMDCVTLLQDISQSYNEKNHDTFITIIQMKLGKEAFGTTPGEGVIMATFRSFEQKRIDEMTKEAIDALQHHMKSFKGSWEHQWVEVFPSIINNSTCYEIVSKAVEDIGGTKIEMKEPFSWSEDFSCYLHRYPGTFFGIGAGENHHVLHNPSYDFPDELIPYGIKIFKGIISETQKQYHGGFP
jgi:amidohydrolase